MTGNLIIHSHKKIVQLLTDRQKNHGKRAIFYAVLLAFADLVAISATVPLLVLTIDKHFLNKSSKLRWVYAQTGLETEGQFLVFMIIAILVFFLVKNVLALWHRNYIKKHCTAIATMYAKRLYNKYLQQEHIAQTHKGTSEMVDRLVYYPFQLSHGIIFPYLTFITEGITVLFISLLLLFYNPIVFLVAFVILLPTLFLVFKLVKRKIYTLGKVANEHREETVKNINIGLKGLEEVKLNRLDNYFATRYLREAHKFLKANLDSLFYQFIPSRTNEMAAMMGLIIFAIYGYFFSDNVGGTRVLAALFALSIFRVVPALNKLLASYMNLKSYQWVLEEKLPEPINKDKEVPIAFDQEINLNNIGFQFPDSDKPLLEGIHLSIPKGTCVGIYGASGNGKSTLLKIIMGIIKPTTGSVLVDKSIIDCYNLNAWQSQLAYVSQNPFILDGSLKENIALGTDEGELNQQQLISAIKDASLNSFFTDWQENLDIQLGEGGALISEGQKQRISIARALYKNVETLLLDEATSALDEENEQQIQDTIAYLKEKKYTIVIIAHNKEFLKICDKVYRLENRRLTEEQNG